MDDNMLIKKIESFKKMMGDYLKKRFPQIYNKNLFKNKFTQIYNKNLFMGTSSKSGAGSDLEQTKRIREEIPKILDKLDIKILIDAPCGDFFWMKEINLNVEKYYGIDIVEEVIIENTKKHGNVKKIFLCKNIISDGLPYADLIFCRDCLVHVPLEQAKQIIKNFKKTGAKYLLTTTFTEVTQNYDSIRDDNIGKWRPLNLLLDPFNLPEPLLIINEGCTEGNNEFQDKSLGLWELKDINID
jgi:hypothetical protein